MHASKASASPTRMVQHIYDYVVSQIKQYRCSLFSPEVRHVNTGHIYNRYHVYKVKS